MLPGPEFEGGCGEADRTNILLIFENGYKPQNINKVILPVPNGAGIPVKNTPRPPARSARLDIRYEQRKENNKWPKVLDRVVNDTLALEASNPQRG